MKTRFLTAILHEAPGANFQSAVERNRIRQMRCPQPGSAGVSPACQREEIGRRDAGAPREAQIVSQTNRYLLRALEPIRFFQNFRVIGDYLAPHGEENPADLLLHGRKQMFRCFATGLVSVALLLFASGCKHTQPKYSSVPGFEATRLKPTSANQAVSPGMTTMTNALDPVLLRAPTNLFTLGPGDKLEIELGNETNSVTTTIVGPDGKIYFSLLPGLDVWGLTLGQTRETIQREIARYVRGQPQVNVTLRAVESKRVWLLGRCQQPGVYNMSAPMTLLEAVAMAGGSQSFAGARQLSEGGPLGEDLADLRHSFVVRGGQMLPVNFDALLNKGDLSQNIYLQPDDFVYFASGYAKEVYVLGAVTQPKPVQYVSGMTLIQAIAGAYGTVRDAYLAHTVIVRGSLAQPQIAVVNYYDIVKGKAPDVALEPHDIVYVPLTPYRYLRKYLDVALNTFVSSVAINAGTRAGTGSSKAPAGIIIPVGSGITIIPPPAPPIH
jgi:polysaccharide export outer membrane protein